MKSIYLMIKPSSSNCSMNCKYCFYEDVSKHRQQKTYGMMNLKTAYQLIDRIFEIDTLENIGFVFQGGEPTLIGIDYYKAFSNYVDQKKAVNQKINYYLQTNGLQQSDEWIMYLKKYNYLVGISIDGDEKYHNNYRKMNNNQDTYNKIIEHTNAFIQAGIDVNILSVITKERALDAPALFNYYIEQGFKYVQCIPCLANLDEKDNEYSLTPELYFTFYNDLFHLWKKEFYKGNKITVNLFDNVIPMFKGIPPYACGALGKCNINLVVESDGSIYPCDFYVMDQYKLGSIENHSIKEMINSFNAQKFINEKDDTELCKVCKFYQMCFGNCKRMKDTIRSETYCGYQHFLEVNHKELQYISQFY